MKIMKIPKGYASRSYYWNHTSTREQGNESFSCSVRSYLMGLNKSLADVRLEQHLRDDLKLLDDDGEISKISRKRLAVRFPAMKSPLYLTKKLARRSICLLCFDVGLSTFCLKKEKKNKKKRKEPRFVPIDGAGLQEVRIKLMP